MGSIFPALQIARVVVSASPLFGLSFFSS